jgi:hypothetical protein
VRELNEEIQVWVETTVARLAPQPMSSE